jgi:tetratricopeptide (TPR) repeat protein
LQTDVLAGQALEYTEDAPRATDILYNLRQRIPSSEPAALARVDDALANIFLRRGKWRLALASLDRIVELIPAAIQAECESKKFGATQALQTNVISCLTKTCMCEIMSRQGRVLLQAGVLFEAAEIFETAKILWTEVEASIPEELRNHEAVKLMPCQMEVNEALFYFSKSHYDHAIQSFSKAVDLLRKTDNFHTRYRSGEWVGPSIITCEAANVLYSEAINNIALCHLYTCNMKEAVDLLEGLVRQDPTSFLSERVAFNLSTLYELGSDSATGTRKKRVLQLIAKRFFLHDVGPESFRVT